ncbi:hypothetical protein HAX54_003452 [Datura stramonium]|uniref:Uncharacterized protein n=1 Tax=Datura stramonium TaxID=4076 RepID=A0ABS8WW50_DATST|nr:hypothetical protein [Datura stramonium]
MQSVTSKGPGSQETSSDQIDGHGGSDSKLNGQQPDVHTPSLSNVSHKEQVCMHGKELGCKDVNRIFTHQNFKALRELSRNQVPQTDAPISSNPSSSPSGTDTHASPSSKIPSPKAVPVDSVVLSPGDDKAGGGDAGVIVVSPVVTKAGTDISHKDGSDFSSENLFEGALTESKEGTYNILQSEAEIIEGFITALGVQEKDVGEESPSAEGHRPGSVSECPFIHNSREPSSQEAPPIVASPKWDGTPTQPDMEIPVN